MIFSIQIAYFWAACFTKISVLLFYRRLASDSYSRFFKWTLLAGAAFLVIFTLTFQILLLFTCRPIAAAWLHWDPVYATTTDWSCMSIATQNDIAIVAASLSVFTDFYAVVLPASLLMRIRISTRQKVGLLLIFGLGFLYVCPHTGPQPGLSLPQQFSLTARFIAVWLASASHAPSSSPARSPTSATSPGTRSPRLRRALPSATLPSCAPRHRVCGTSLATSSET